MPPAQLGQQVQDDREEAVVGQQGCAVTALVVTEPLDHRERDADSGVLLLVAVDAPQHYSARFIGGLVVGLVPTTATHVLAVVARWLPGWEGSPLDRQDPP